MFEDELLDKGMERNVDLKMVLPNKVSFKHLIFYWIQLVKNKQWIQLVKNKQDKHCL